MKTTYARNNKSYISIYLQTISKGCLAAWLVGDVNDVKGFWTLRDNIYMYVSYVCMCVITVAIVAFGPYRR
jgi:hypothetical protein